MDPALWIFVVVYLGMALGGLPWLKLDRSGIALLGAVLFCSLGGMTLQSAWNAVDAPTLSLLLGLMLLSAQLRLGGFYARITRRIAADGPAPERLLLSVMLAAGLLSALLTNDVICLGMAPALVDIAHRRGLDPVPLLLGLAAASNLGSAATILGNPQNLLIGQALDVPFLGYLAVGAPPAVLSLLFAFAVIRRAYRGRFLRAEPPRSEPDRPFDRWQTGKGLVLLVLLVVALCFEPLPRAVLCLLCGGATLCSRRLHARDLMGEIDWPLLVLFAGLFVVHAGLQQAGHPERWLQAATTAGLDLRDPDALFWVTATGSNLVSNVPLVMLLLPFSAGPEAAAVLCLASSFAGNLLLFGSIANLIVVEQAQRLGVSPRGRGWFAEHMRLGVPITLGSLAIAWAWLRVCAG